MDKSVKVYFILGPFLMARSMWKMGFTLVGQMLKNLPAMQETQIWSLGWEDPLENGMATQCKGVFFQVLF